MSAARVRLLFALLCLAPVAGSALYLSQLDPVSPLPQRAAAQATGVDGAFMARQLERVRVRTGALPCPREMESARGGLCVEADKDGIGLLLGSVPRAALGVRDAIGEGETPPEGWRYVVDLSATIPDFCHLAPSGPLRWRGRAVAAAFLPPEAASWALPKPFAARQVMLPAEAIPVEGCPLPLPPRPTHAEGITPRGVWSFAATEKSEPRPLPEGLDAAQPLVAADPSGLVLANLRTGGAWVDWHVWDGAARQWLRLGQWRVLEGMRVAQMAFAGERLLLTIQPVAAKAGALQLVDLPLWAHRRPVLNVHFPNVKSASWAALASAGELPAAYLLPQGEHWQWQALSKQPLTDAFAFPHFPQESAQSAKTLRLQEDGRGTSWLSWHEGKPSAQLWLRAGTGWKSQPVQTDKAVIDRALFLSTPSRLLVLVREKTAAHWQGWLLEGEALSALPAKELPSAQSLPVALWPAP